MSAYCCGLLGLGHFYESSTVSKHSLGARVNAINLEINEDMGGLNHSIYLIASFLDIMSTFESHAATFVGFRGGRGSSVSLWALCSGLAKVACRDDCSPCRERACVHFEQRNRQSSDSYQEMSLSVSDSSTRNGSHVALPNSWTEMKVKTLTFVLFTWS